MIIKTCPSISARVAATFTLDCKSRKERRPKLLIFSIRKVSYAIGEFFFSLPDQTSEAPVCAPRKVYKLLLEIVVNTRCISNLLYISFFAVLNFVLQSMQVYNYRLSSCKYVRLSVFYGSSATTLV